MAEVLPQLSLHYRISDNLERFTAYAVANAAKGKGMDRLSYFQDLLILEFEGVLQRNPDLNAAVIKSGQDPLIWEGVYLGVEACVNVLQNPDTSPDQKQGARETLQAYFRITEITRMDALPNYPDPAVQQKVLKVWEDTWNNLNTWRSFLQEEAITPSPPTKAQPAVSPQPPAPDSKPSKLSWIEQIREVVHIERIQAPDLEGDIEGAVEELERQITARSIYGKFPPEVRIKERVFHHNNAKDSTEYGDEEAGGFSGDRKVHTVLGLIYSLLHGRRDQSPAFKELAKKHFLMAVNIPETPDAILSYQFLQNWSDSYRRAASVVAMNFRLPRESAYKLLGLVRKDPEAAEMFLQKAADGFEAEDPNLPKVGIPRVRAEEIVILNLDRLNPGYFNPRVYTDPRIIAQDIVQNPNGQTETYKYPAPHGIADPNKIPL